MKKVIGAAIALAVIALVLGAGVDDDGAQRIAQSAGTAAVILGIVALVMADQP